MILRVPPEGCTVTMVHRDGSRREVKLCGPSGLAVHRFMIQWPTAGHYEVDLQAGVLHSLYGTDVSDWRLCAADLRSLRGAVPVPEPGWPRIEQWPPK